jgi:transketolase
MINKNIFTQVTESDGKVHASVSYAATREGFGQALLELGAENNSLVALCADLTESVQMQKFKDAYPGRFVEVGIAEQNMAGVASGMAAMGLLPVMASYAAFNPGRNWEQIRTTICYNNQKVIIVGAHAGLSVGPDGGTHQALEDIALMRVLPNITVLSPSDSFEAYQLMKQSTQIEGPVYLRLAREKSPMLYEKNYAPKIGKAEIVYVSKSKSAQKVGIIATGPVLYEALLAAKELDSADIQVGVLNVHTIKPIDQKQIINFATSFPNIITVEEGQVAGGLGGLVAEILAQHKPTRMVMLGSQDRYGQSGTVAELYHEYGIDKDSIVRAAILHLNTYF